MEQEVENNLHLGNREHIFKQRKSTPNKKSEVSDFEKFASFYIENSMVSHAPILYKKTFKEVLREFWDVSESTDKKELRGLSSNVKKMLTLLGVYVSCVSIAVLFAFSDVLNASGDDIFWSLVLLFICVSAIFSSVFLNSLMSFVIRHVIYVHHEVEIEKKLIEFKSMKSLKELGIDKELINIPGE